MAVQQPASATNAQVNAQLPSAAPGGTPPPQYLQPKVSEEVPWETRQHLQLLYQKQGELVQALTIMQQQLAKLTGGGK